MFRNVVMMLIRCNNNVIFVTLLLCPHLPFLKNGPRTNTSENCSNSSFDCRLEWNESVI